MGDVSITKSCRRRAKPPLELIMEQRGGHKQKGCKLVSLPLFREPNVLTRARKHGAIETRHLNIETRIKEGDLFSFSEEERPMKYPVP